MILIIKKEEMPSFLSLKMVKEYRFKLIALIVKKYYEKKGYEVEVEDN